MSSNSFRISFLFTCIIIGVILFLSSFNTSKEPQPVTVPMPSQYTFAITLQPSANNSLITYWIVGILDDKIVMKNPISETNFILQMKGEQYSKANLEGIDLFEKIEMDSCFYSYIKKDHKCHPLSLYKLNDLWTLRYHRNPECPEGCTAFDGMRVQGLAANKTYPSDAQMEILRNNYNVSYHTDFFYGENMLKLFSDINNNEWVNNYENAK